MRLVFFPFHDWRKSRKEGFRTRDGHVLLGLLAHPEVESVLCVNRPVPLPLWPTTSNPVHRSRVLKRESEKLHVLDTVDLQFSHLLRGVHAWWPRAVSAKSHLTAIRWAMSELGWTPATTTALCCTPYDAIQLPSMGFDCLAFDAIDDWEHHPRMRAGAYAARNGYEVVRATFDVAFAVSQPLAARLSGGRASVIELRNGVDASMIDGPVYEKAEGIGYAGKLSHRIDVEAIRRLAEVAPVPIQVAGPVLERVVGRALKAIPNCHLLGDVPYPQLPRFIDSLRVALIPHSVGPDENGGDPIKIYEYLARGKTVVTTPILGVDRFAGTRAVRIATRGDFAQAALDAYAHPATARQARALLRPDDTWSAKIDSIVGALHRPLTFTTAVP